MNTIPPTVRMHERDTYLFDFEGTVLARRTEGDTALLALDRSAFYVESGGQPSDAGSIEGHEVLELREEDGVIWHRLASSVALEPGSRVRGRIDTARRLDHMQQHTGQHLLSAACLRAFGGDTVSFHLGREESTIDLAGPEPDRGCIAAALECAHDCILGDRPIRIHEVEREALAHYPLRKDPGAEHEVLRLIEIEDFDWSPCGGTHARRAGEVGPIHVLGWEKGRGAWRIRFLAGRRTLGYLSEIHHLLEETAREHSLHWRQLPETLRGWKERALALEKDLQRLRAERGEQTAETRFAAEAPDREGSRRFALWLGAVCLDEARPFVNRLTALGPARVLVGGHETGRAYWIAARSAELPAKVSSWHAGHVLKAWLEARGGKGGGNDRFAQGSAPPPPSESELLAELTRVFLES